MNSQDRKKQTAEEREQQKQEEYRRQMAQEEQRRAAHPKEDHDWEERKRDSWDEDLKAGQPDQPAQIKMINQLKHWMGSLILPLTSISHPSNLGKDYLS